MAKIYLVALSIAAEAASALVSMYLTRIKMESPQLYQSSLSLCYA